MCECGVEHCASHLARIWNENKAQIGMISCEQVTGSAYVGTKTGRRCINVVRFQATTSQETQRGLVRVESYMRNEALKEPANLCAI